MWMEGIAGDCGHHHDHRDYHLDKTFCGLLPLQKRYKEQLMSFIFSLVFRLDGIDSGLIRG